MFRKLEPDSELGKQVSTFISKNKEGQLMTKKFTEEEYQKIVEIADKYFDQHKELAVTVNLKNIYDYIFYNETVEKLKIGRLNQELIAIALPKTREWAHDHFVEKEKKYYWRHKKTDKLGKRWYLSKQSGLVSLNAKDKSGAYPFTESKIRSWGYDVDMYEKKEVE
ncbi:hypothetical protein [Fructobacillus cardui]|uniref:hypothetical protein n=1 Tax=Fructobacillus cardui TaxID=2893170 RepID=UPI002D90CA7A|nr:hypothetical protein R53653_IHELHDKM_01032 [Fructobacillus cardui]